MYVGLVSALIRAWSAAGSGAGIRCGSRSAALDPAALGLEALVLRFPGWWLRRDWPLPSHSVSQAVVRRGTLTGVVTT